MQKREHTHHAPVIAAFSPQTGAPHAGEEALEQLRGRLATLASDLDAEPAVVADEAAAGLIAASAQVDLLVMGSRGLGSKRAVVLGSGSRRVIAHSACPVLVIPRGAHQGSATLLSDSEAHTPGAA